MVARFLKNYEIKEEEEISIKKEIKAEKKT